MSNNWLVSATEEIHLAESSRQAGNEGRARVCARRAVGHILAEYFSRKRILVDTPSAYDRIKLFQSQPETPEAAREISGHFLQKLTPEFTLPIPADLIADARWLARELLGEEIPSAQAGNS